MKRVLTLATLYPNPHQPRFGTFVARQMEALAARGDWDVTVINPIGVPPVRFGRYRTMADAAVSDVSERLKVHRPLFPIVPKLSGPFNPALIADAVLQLARLLHAQAPFDLVDAQFFYPDGPAAARIAHVLGLPLSIKARGADISYWGARSYARRQMLAAGSRARGLLAVSEALAGDMVGMGLDPTKITIHYTGLDHMLFRPADRAASRARLIQDLGLPLPTDAPVLATVGALIERKGQLITLRALHLLPDAHLLLVGNGPDRAMLERAASELGVSGRVHFLGSLDHALLPVVLSAADAMVLPSASEGLANAWVEALACGTPLVITEAGGARELLTSPAYGRIAAREPEAIAAAVRESLADPPAPATVAQGAARFTWEANAAALAGYFERLTAG